MSFCTTVDETLGAELVRPLQSLCMLNIAAFPAVFLMAGAPLVAVN